jgi:isopentenyldiphosphate isomerase
MEGDKMSKVIKCSVIIFDDYNNVLIAERGKGKKDSPKLWGIFGRNLRGKEDEETCISKVVDKDLTCTVFDLTPFKQYPLAVEDEGTLQVFTGRIREMVSLHKEINKVKWISAREVDNYDFAEGEKELIVDFLNSVK